MSILTVTITIDVDPAVWADEYGLESDEIQEDLVNHLPGLLHEVVKGKAEQLGTFTITNTTGELDGCGDDNSRSRRRRDRERAGSPDRVVPRRHPPRAIAAGTGEDGS